VKLNIYISARLVTVRLSCCETCICVCCYLWV